MADNRSGKITVTTSLPKHGETYNLLTTMKVNTVCLESSCPNVGDCFSQGVATFLILGASCTRSCSFCAVAKSVPGPPDPAEPFRMVAAARELNLSRVVVTSVTRDDLADGGAGYFAQTIRLLKAAKFPEIEVLIPDFQGNIQSLATVLQEQPDILAHNMETIPRLYPSVRPQASYHRSLELLAAASAFPGNIQVKSGIMVGLGETDQEVASLLKDIKDTGCTIITIGQYLKPIGSKLPVAEYVSSEKFTYYRELALNLGFNKVWSGPLVRSSIGN